MCIVYVFHVDLCMLTCQAEEDGLNRSALKALRAGRKAETLYNFIISNVGESCRGRGGKEKGKHFIINLK